jgi:hypothetical protein
MVILDIGERIVHAIKVDARQGLETILRSAVIGHHLKRGLDPFKLEFVREPIIMRRDILTRHAGHDDNV